MKTLTGFTLAVLALTSTSSAQAPAAGQQIGFTAGLQRSYAGNKKEESH